MLPRLRNPKLTHPLRRLLAPPPRRLSSAADGGDAASEWTGDILYLDSSNTPLSPPEPGLRPTSPGLDSHTLAGSLRRPIPPSAAAAKIADLARRWHWGPDLDSHLDQLPFPPSSPLISAALPLVPDPDASLALFRWARRHPWFLPSDSTFSLLLDRLAADPNALLSLFNDMLSVSPAPAEVRYRGRRRPAADAPPDSVDLASSSLSAVVMSSGANKKSSGSGGGPKIRTLADLNRSSGPGSDSDDNEPQEYYAGGEKSGMLVQDPSKGNHDVDAIFDQARQMGAMEGPLEHDSSSSSRSFTGTGRLLSGDTVAPAQQPRNMTHNICFWTNGFTVNDGPLRRFDDPENAPFLESIRKSECPTELEPADRRTMINVNLIRKHEKCPEPVKRQTPFQGVGRTLGGESSSGPAAVQPTDTAAAPAPYIGISVDPSLPLTSIQLRLADGTRLVGRFNMHQTVGDIRAFIDASRPGTAKTYQLQTVGFPPKQLADLSQTIEQLGLANSVVIQKL